MSGASVLLGRALDPPGQVRHFDSAEYFVPPCIPTADQATALSAANATAPTGLAVCFENAAADAGDNSDGNEHDADGGSDDGAASAASSSTASDACNMMANRAIHPRGVLRRFDSGACL